MNVLLFAEEPILALGLKRSLEETGQMHLAGVCSRVEELAQQVEQVRPDVLLLDLTSEVTFAVLSRLRELTPSPKVILWVQAISTELALQAASLGVRGILRRTLPVETLIRCLQRVAEGELWFEKALTDSIMTTRSYALTRREGQMISLLSQGLKNKEIATALSISEGTVKVYMSRLFQKTGVNDRFELALYGLRNLAPGSRVTDAADVSSAKRGVAGISQPPRSFFMERLPMATRPMAGLRAAS
jgi:DNA-binding NarL/FixJ family response regulator